VSFAEKGTEAMRAGRHEDSRRRWNTRRLRYPVELDRSHLDTLSKSALDGIVELVWNSIDADARRIVIDLMRNEAEGVTGYRIVDDGHGISPQKARDSFVRLGGSWKHLTARSPADRPLHGKLGQGRFVAFSHGGVARWNSVAIDEQDRPVRTRIEITADAMDACEISDAEPVQASTGTRVELEGLGQPVHGLDGTGPRQKLISSLALPIAAYDLEIVFDGELLDPAQIENQRAGYDLSDFDGQPAHLEVIEWSVNIRRSIFLCNAAGVALLEINPGFRAADFRYSAYVQWDGFAEQINELPVIELQGGPAKNLLDEAREQLQQHFENRRGERRSDLVSRWRDDGVYPFVGDAGNPAERATRETFDLVALQAAEVINAGQPKARKLSLRLLREALERNPATLHHVLTDVLALEAEQVEDLSLLLKKTPLAGVIAASSAIADRLEFVQGLAAMTTDPKWKRLVLERSQLHKVLEKQTWVLGEEYHLAVSDKSLHNVLKHHRQKLGIGEDADEIDLQEGEARDSTGRRRIVDLLFDAEIPQYESQRHHLVIELKRPSVSVGAKELEQIKNYAASVAADPRYDTQSTRWEFWVISTAVAGTADRDRRQRDKLFGLVAEWEEPRIQIWVKTWAEILRGAEHRLKFVRDKLGYSPGDEEALSYLARRHADELPTAMTTPNASRSEAVTDPPVSS